MPCPPDGFFVRTIKKKNDDTGFEPFPQRNESDWEKNIEEGKGGCLTARMFVMNSLGMDYDDIHYMNRERQRNDASLEKNKAILEEIKVQNALRNLSDPGMNRSGNAPGVQGDDENEDMDESENDIDADEDPSSGPSSWVNRGDRPVNLPTLLHKSTSIASDELEDSVQDRIKELTEERDTALSQRDRMKTLSDTTIAQHAQQQLRFEEQE